MRPLILLPIFLVILLASCNKTEDEAPKTPMKEANHITAHKASIRHKESLTKSSQCGCFHCLAIFPPTDISEWTDTSNPEAQHTALCPKCGIDSVIGSDSGYPITKDFLLAMKKHWF